MEIRKATKREVTDESFWVERGKSGYQVLGVDIIVVYGKNADLSLFFPPDILRSHGYYAKRERRISINVGKGSCLASRVLLILFHGIEWKEIWPSSKR